MNKSFKNICKKMNYYITLPSNGADLQSEYGKKIIPKQISLQIWVNQ